MPQAQGMTVDQYYGEFKKSLEANDPNAISFANQVGEKYGKLGRRATRQEFVGLMVQQGIIDAPSDLPADKISGLLQGLQGTSKGGESKQEPKPGPPESGGFFSKPLIDRIPGARKGIESLAGALAVPPAVQKVAGQLPGKQGAEKTVKGVIGFQKGVAEGFADAGMDMTSPKNLALAAGTFLTGKATRAVKLVSLVRKMAAGAFTVQSLADLAQEAPQAYELYQKGDYEGAGKAAAKAATDILIGYEGVKSYRAGTVKAEAKAKPASEAPPEPVKAPKREPGATASGKSLSAKPLVSADARVSERVAHPQLVEDIQKARSASKRPAAESRGRGRIAMEPESRTDILREIGNLQESASTPHTEARINELRAKLGLPAANVPPHSTTQSPAPPEPVRPDVPSSQFEFGPPPEPMADAPPSRAGNPHKPFPFDNQTTRRGSAAVPQEGAIEGPPAPPDSGRTPASRQATRDQGVSARDALAQKLLGQPFDSLRREDRVAIQSLVDEQNAASRPKKAEKPAAAKAPATPAPVKAAGAPKPPRPVRRARGSQLDHAERYYPGKPAQEGAAAPAEPSVSHVGPVHPEVADATQHFLDTAVRPAGLEKSPWKGAQVEILGEDGRPIGAAVALNNEGFTPEAIQALVEKAGGKAKGVRITNADNPKERWSRFFSKVIGTAQPAAPPEPVR